MKTSALLALLFLYATISYAQSIHKISIDGVEMYHLYEVVTEGNDYYLLCAGYDSNLYLIKYNSSDAVVWSIQKDTFNNTPVLKIDQDKLYLLLASDDSTEFFSYAFNGEELYHLNFSNTHQGYAEFDHFEVETSHNIILYLAPRELPIFFPHFMVLNEKGEKLSEFTYEKENSLIGTIKEDRDENIIMTIDNYSFVIDPELEYRDYNYTNLLKISNDGDLVWEIENISEAAPKYIEFDISNRIFLFADNYKIKAEPDGLSYAGEQLYNSEITSTAFHYYACNGLGAISYDFTNDLIYYFLFDPDDPYKLIRESSVPFPGPTFYQEINKYQYDLNGYVSALIESNGHQFYLFLFDILGNLIMNPEIFSYEMSDGISSVKYKTVNGRIIVFYTQDEDPGSLIYNVIYKKDITISTPVTNVLADCNYYAQCENMISRYDEKQKMIYAYLPELTLNTIYSFDIYDLTGKLIKHVESYNNAELDASKINRGIYILTAKNGSDIICTNKILID